MHLVGMITLLILLSLGPGNPIPGARISHSIITDNGTQFTGRKFLDLCEDHHIRVD
jgi:hypothetical protein